MGTKYMNAKRAAKRKHVKDKIKHELKPDKFKRNMSGRHDNHLIGLKVRYDPDCEWLQEVLNVGKKNKKADW